MTKSPFTKSERLDKRAKLLFVGPVGVGKTYLSLQFPNVCVIDTERGTELYGDQFDFDVFHCTDPDSVLDTVRWLATSEHKYKTVVIDSYSNFYEALQEKWCSILHKRKGGTAGDKVDYYELQPKDWSHINAASAKLLRHLLMLDMNVIVTTKTKPLYADGEFMKKIGEQPDGPRKMLGFFDSIISLKKEGGKRWGCADCEEWTKNRGDILPSGLWPLSFGVFDKAFGQMLYGEVEPVKFITEDQRIQIEERLGVDLAVTDDKMKSAIRRMFNKPELMELTFDEANEMIEYMQQRLEKQRAKEAKNIRE